MTQSAFNPKPMAVLDGGVQSPRRASVREAEKAAPLPGPVFSPDQVISALMGQQGVVLHGFGEIDPMLDGHIPNVPLSLLSDARAQDEAIEAVAQKQKHRSWLLLAALVLAMTLVGVGIGVVIDKATAAPAAASSINWSVLSVRQDGLEVSVANLPVFFAIGSTLPSGEVLLSVDPVIQSFSTDNQVVSLTKNNGK